MPTTILATIAYLAFAVASAGTVLLFLDTLILRFDWRILLKAIGFGALSLAAAITVGDPVPLPLALLLSGGGSYLILIATAADLHSRLRFLLILPPLGAALLPLPLLLMLISLLITITIAQLIYTTRHRELIPLALTFTFLAGAEAGYAYLPAAPGSLLAPLSQLAAALTLLVWLWFYLVKRIIFLTRTIRQ